MYPLHTIKINNIFRKLLRNNFKYNSTYYCILKYMFTILKVIHLSVQLYCLFKMYINTVVSIEVW